MSLIAKAWVSLAVVTVIMGGLLFIPAGTMRYWQAWLYLAVYVVASALIVAYLIRHDRTLLERRMRGGPTAEKTVTQRLAMLFASLGFIAALLVPALDHRFHWSSVPLPLELGGDAANALWFYMAFVVFQVNPYSAATVQIAEGQTVITTGPYALVRHPLYAGGVLCFIGTPLALGSWWGLLAVVVAMPALIWRMFDEEKVLVSGLPGYAEYAARVRYRLIPGVF